MQVNPLSEEKLEWHVLDWLAAQGFRLIKRNWAYCSGRIDIIASQLDQLHFIGLTTRSYPDQHIAAEGITRRKMLAFLQASKLYLQRHPEWNKVLLDMLVVTMIDGEPKDCILTGNIDIKVSA